MLNKRYLKSNLHILMTCLAIEINCSQTLLYSMFNGFINPVQTSYPILGLSILGAELVCCNIYHLTNIEEELSKKLANIMLIVLCLVALSSLYLNFITSDKIYFYLNIIHIINVLIFDIKDHKISFLIMILLSGLLLNTMHINIFNIFPSLVLIFLSTIIIIIISLLMVAKNSLNNVLAGRIIILHICLLPLHSYFTLYSQYRELILVGASCIDVIFSLCIAKMHLVEKKQAKLNMIIDQSKAGVVKINAEKTATENLRLAMIKATQAVSNAREAAYSTAQIVKIAVEQMLKTTKINQANDIVAKREIIKVKYSAIKKAQEEITTCIENIKISLDHMTIDEKNIAEDVIIAANIVHLMINDSKKAFRTMLAALKIITKAININEKIQIATNKAPEIAKNIKIKSVEEVREEQKLFTEAQYTAKEVCKIKEQLENLANQSILGISNTVLANALHKLSSEITANLPKI